LPPADDNDADNDNADAPSATRADAAHEKPASTARRKKAPARKGK
jgi:hypothetical protein